jgi:hypothetical protein
VWCAAARACACCATPAPRPHDHRRARDDAVVPLLLGVRHQKLQLAHLQRVAARGSAWQRVAARESAAHANDTAASAPPHHRHRSPAASGVCTCRCSAPDTHTHTHTHTHSHTHANTAAHTLLPDSCIPLRSSRLIHSSTPSGSSAGGSRHLRCTCACWAAAETRCALLPVLTRRRAGAPLCRTCGWASAASPGGSAASAARCRHAHDTAGNTTGTRVCESTATREQLGPR